MVGNFECNRIHPFGCRKETRITRITRSAWECDGGGKGEGEGEGEGPEQVLKSE